ncbi:MAG: class I SAM-dependent methyltransferase [Chloroflexi bacterium]|nr:class I SAM-dependent methyltransferase [Chloroflexota bacterium]
MNPILRLMRKSAFVRRRLYALLRRRGLSMVAEISPFFNNPRQILDVGCGSCNITELLREQNYEVMPLDVTDYSLVGSITPTLYDGQTMPFEDQAFDLAIILTTLHHTPDVARILAEAARVATQIIVMEDVYKNNLHKHATWWLDSLINLEFSGHPHSNKSDQAWRALFTQLGLSVVAVKQRWFLGVMWQLTYRLE